SDDSSAEAAKARAAAAAQAHGAGGQAQAVTESRKVTADRQRTTASHHALVVDATARGAGFMRGGAGLELTVYAELVYVGNDAPARPPLLPPAPPSYDDPNGAVPPPAAAAIVPLRPRVDAQPGDRPGGRAR